MNCKNAKVVSGWCVAKQKRDIKPGLRVRKLQQLFSTTAKQKQTKELQT